MVASSGLFPEKLRHDGVGLHTILRHERTQDSHKRGYSYSHYRASAMGASPMHFFRNSILPEETCSVRQHMFISIFTSLAISPRLSSWREKDQTKIKRRAVTSTKLSQYALKTQAGRLHTLGVFSSVVSMSSFKGKSVFKMVINPGTYLSLLLPQGQTLRYPL